MKLRRLAINRLPGIKEPFEVEFGGAGIHVVFGPNGIGKSSLCRAMKALYWQEHGPSQGVSVNAEFEREGDRWWVEREGGHVRWQREGEDSIRPPLPALHNRHCFFLRLRDLIDPTSEGTRDVATEIRRQMSGGIDLDKVKSGLFSGIGPRHGRSEWRVFDTARNAVLEAERKQVSLQRRADQLETLRNQLDAADATAGRRAALDRAIGLATRLDERARNLDQLSALPAGLARLTGKEAEQLAALESRVESLAQRAQSLEQQLAASRKAQQETALSAPISEAEVSAWRGYAEELTRVELALQAARTELSGCRQELASARSALGGAQADDVELTLADHSRLFNFLRAAEAQRTKVAVIEERLRLLARLDVQSADLRDQDRLRKAADVLRAWLRAPAPETFADRIRSRRLWIVVAAAVSIAGIGLAVLVEPIFALLFAIGAGIALPVFMLRNGKAAAHDRKAARAAFDPLGVQEPAAWDIPSVESRLRDLEREIAAIDARSQRARDRDVERQNLESAREALAEAEATLEAQRQRLQADLKLAAPLPDAELVDLTRALDQYRSAKRTMERAAGRVTELAAQHSQLLSTLAEVLEGHGEPRPGDAATAAAGLNRLVDRNARLVRAIASEEQASNQLAELSRDREAALAARAGLYAEAGLDDGDRHGLLALLEALPRYREVKETVARLESQIALDRSELAKTGETELATLDRPDLERLQHEVGQAAEKGAELRNEIARINAEVEEAQKGCNLQNLIAARDQALARLQERQEEALYAAAGTFLIDSVEEEYEQTQMPRVLERARGHFSTFTHHNYDLRLAKDSEAPRLIAIDLRSREGLGLEALSDGTRGQLLLAARLAFAEEVEHGATLPLFLDEALDQSDPLRFAAIVRSLCRLANDQGRQIFYLTSDPHDVDRIQHALAEESGTLAGSIDLGLLRRNAASVRDPGLLSVVPRPSVPAPEGLSAEAYGVALGIPLFQPGLGHTQQHIFYLLLDDLPLIHRFLVNGLERVGQWKMVSGTDLAQRLASGPISSQEIAARVELLEVFCELWKQGRGRPVDRDALESSGALSERYLHNVVAIAAELGCDPEKLLTYLADNKDPRLRGFRRNSAHNLEQYLRDHGYLDDLAVLGEEDLCLRALASPAANRLPEGVASVCLHHWWALAQKGTGRSVEPSRPKAPAVPAG